MYLPYSQEIKILNFLKLQNFPYITSNLSKVTDTTPTRVSESRHVPIHIHATFSEVYVLQRCRIWEVHEKGHYLLGRTNSDGYDILSIQEQQLK